MNGTRQHGAEELSGSMKGVIVGTGAVVRNGRGPVEVAADARKNAQCVGEALTSARCRRPGRVRQDDGEWQAAEYGWVSSDQGC